jgi:hypothetical protein
MVLAKYVKNSTISRKNKMKKYEFGSSGIKINGDDSYHVVKVLDAEEWLLLRQRKGSYFEAAVFASADEARAFVHALDLDLNKL